MTRADDTLTAMPAIAGARVIAQIRALLVTVILTGIAYSVLSSATRGGCSGGRDSSGRMVDGNGLVTDVVPECVQMTVGPSPLMFAFFGGAVLWAIGRVLRRAQSEGDAIRTLRRTARVVMIVAIVGAVVAQLWFWLMPLWGLDGQGTYVFPFPFASFTVETYPMTTP
ncbi:hypothetical protein ABXJ56_08955 [Microbacterium chocolatum]|uniref:hypothetical protein n=1 Tax=Microbacterium aurantiacum TaxID=162393 RepID=UPI0033905629